LIVRSSCWVFQLGSSLPDRQGTWKWREGQS
jgi:hypothetical protein